MHKCPTQQISLIIWDDKLQVKFAWNGWCEMPCKGDCDSLQSVAASNGDLISFKKDVISRMVHTYLLHKLTQNVSFSVPEAYWYC